MAEGSATAVTTGRGTGTNSGMGIGGKPQNLQINSDWVHVQQYGSHIIAPTMELAQYVCRAFLASMPNSGTAPTPQVTPPTHKQPAKQGGTQTPKQRAALAKARAARAANRKAQTREAGV